MIRNMDELLKAASSGKSHTLAVACAQDPEVLRAVWTARKAGMAEAVLVGDEARIRALAETSQLSLDDFSIVHEPDETLACRKAVSLIRKGRADALMKGAVPTAVVMRAALDRSEGLRRGSLLSHVAFLELRKWERVLLLTDAALNIAPGLEEKKEDSCKRRPRGPRAGQSVARRRLSLRRGEAESQNACHGGRRGPDGGVLSGENHRLSGVRPRRAG